MGHKLQTGPASITSPLEGHRTISLVQVSTEAELLSLVDPAETRNVWDGTGWGKHWGNLVH